MAEWNFSLESRLHWINQCLANGITTFDHADLYGMHTAEGLFGEALAASPGLRQRMTLVTKCGIRLTNTAPTGVPPPGVKHYDTSRAHIEMSTDNSLRLLRTDVIDLMLIHRPDPLMDADEVADTFSRLHKAGKVKWFGVSNHKPDALALLASRMSAAGLPLVTNQVEISAAHLEAFDDGVLTQAQTLRARPMAWSPLAVGARHGASVEQTAVAWLLKHPAGIIPVLGTGNTERIAELAKSENIALTRDDWYEIYSASRGHDVA
jgi:predicted oxidoreductase